MSDAPPPPRAVIFDWDNTLVDTWPTITRCYNSVFTAFDMVHWTEDETRSRAHGSLRDVFPKLFGERWEEAREIFFGTFNACHLAALRPLDGAPELLRELVARGLYLAVVSNKTGPALRAEVGHLGWDGLFARVVGATDAPRDKPAPDPVTIALSGAGLRPEDPVWFVGDTVVDLQCAHATGCVPVLVRAQEPGPGEFLEYPPRLYARNVHALRALM
ncbi:MAG: HAD family hydrolase [Pseudolabrys sp.]|nr:HAD family hydrolase [Pseudolabrys sp.]